MMEPKLMEAEVPAKDPEKVSKVVESSKVVRVEGVPYVARKRGKIEQRGNLPDRRQRNNTNPIPTTERSSWVFQKTQMKSKRRRHFKILGMSFSDSSAIGGRDSKVLQTIIGGNNNIFGRVRYMRILPIFTNTPNFVKLCGLYRKGGKHQAVRARH
jgi:hypothetical protein